ncbi:hypothetical protein C9374_001877 [Naegleria lovaniensis]|uniref:Uncharacterized protein n=1 Tax=Naegleria lovaniensis TaxID=51637 RepID=A0AA88GQ59_NAELO|nr:uncharacterized protein C9374_001877 [Naegleria lovaniensis]KAG2386842.1 hypothetical protein C9374_001877 [Naegleria lovaniensis]
MASSQQQQDHEIVAKGNKLWEEIFASGQVAQRLGECYLPNAQLTHFGTFAAVHGPTEIAKFFQTVLHDSVGARNPKLTSHVITRLNETTIYELGKVKAELVSGGSLEAPYTVVWQRDEATGEYKIIYDTF